MNELMDDFNYDYDRSMRDGTGSHDENKIYKTIEYPFEKYLIKVKVNESGKFVGVVEVKINKDFLSYKQKVASKGYHNVDEFYKD